MYDNQDLKIKLAAKVGGEGGLAPILKRIVQAWQTDGSYQRTSGADPGFGQGGGGGWAASEADMLAKPTSLCVNTP